MPARWFGQKENKMKKATIVVAVILAMFGLSGTARGQQMTSADLIHDPALISDRVPVRLYLESLSQRVGTYPELLAARINQIGLASGDAKIFETVVKDFAVDHQALIKSEGGTGDQFTNDKYAHIAVLLKRLSTEAQNKLTAFIQGEKRGMQISPFDVGLSPLVRKLPAPMEHAHGPDFRLLTSTPIRPYLFR